MAYEKTYTGVGIYDGKDVDPNWFERVKNLEDGKINKNMLDWGTMPLNITDKKTFYHEVSKVFVNTPDQTIHMYGDQTQLKTFFDIWGKPAGLVATHAIISIRPISNISSKVAFMIYLTSSNDNKGDIYVLSVSGFSGTFLGDTGWINLKTNAVTANALFDLIENPSDGLVVDLSEDETKLHVHLDNNVDIETIPAVRRYLKNNTQCELGQEEVARCKGIRVFYKFKYQDNTLYQCQDIRLPRPMPSGSRYFVSIPIPNPRLFSEMILIQYDAQTGLLEFKAANGGQIDTMQFYDVKCIK